MFGAPCDICYVELELSSTIESAASGQRFNEWVNRSILRLELGTSFGPYHGPFVKVSLIQTSYFCPTLDL